MKWEHEHIFDSKNCTEKIDLHVFMFIHDLQQ